MIRLDILDHWSALDLLKDEWDPFLLNSQAANLFLSWDYLDCWRQTYGGSFQPRVLVARDSHGSIAGIAPLMTGPGHRSVRRLLRHLSFLGQLCDSPPDYCDFLLKPGWETEVMEAFSTHIFSDLAPEWDLLYFPLTRTDSSALALLQDYLAKRNIEPQIVHFQPAPFVSLPASWDAYLASRSKNFRKKFRHPANQLARSHEVKVARAGLDLPLDEAMTTLRALNQERWGAEAESFRSEQFDDFHRRLARRFQDSNRLSLRFLLVDGEPVATQYDFIEPVQKRVYGFQSGWKQQWAEQSVGRILQGECLQAYIHQGIQEYDFLAGESEYKLSWSNGSRTVCDVEIPNPRSVKGRLFSLARSWRSSAAPVFPAKAA